MLILLYNSWFFLSISQFTTIIVATTSTRVRMVQINGLDIKPENCLPETFFDQPCLDLANNLLGKYLVRKLSSGEILIGKIIETEGYCGMEDRASHSYNNKRTPRTEPMFMKSGTIYVYFTYGMYHCFNLSSKEHGSAVLIRSLEPVLGLDIMNNLRNHFNSKRKKNNKEESTVETNVKNIIFTNQSSQNSSCSKRPGSCIESIQAKKSRFKDQDLCNGPSKLCISMDITIESMNKKCIYDDDSIWIQDLDKEAKFTVVKSSRIGIGDFAKEWKDKLLRFYILGNKCVSKTDKKMESLWLNR